MENLQNFIKQRPKPSIVQTTGYRSPAKLKPRREITIAELQTVLDQQIDKIHVINDFMSLNCKKAEIRHDLSALRLETDELKVFVTDTRKKIEIFKNTKLAQTRTLIESMRQQHLKMLEMLEEMDNSENNSVTPNLQSRIR